MAQVSKMMIQTITQLIQPAPLSFVEQRLWFLNQLDGAHPQDRIPQVIQLTGMLNFAALDRACQTIVQRHETLRTRFVLVADRPVKMIAPELHLPIAVVDLTELPSDQRSQQQTTLIQSFIQQPFDLQTGPLLRVSLLRLAEQEHILLICLHHIIADGWSLGVLWHELSELYTAFCQGRSATLPELPIQYSDYTIGQQQQLSGELFATQLEYWQTQLQPPLPILQLPQDAAPTAANAQAASVNLVLPTALTDRLKQLNQQTGTTRFMLLLTALQILLARLSGQTDIIVGTPIAGRQSIETEGLIGLFLNTLAIRTDLSGDPSLRQVLDQVRSVTLDAYDQQDLPFEKLVEVLNPQRDLQRHPVFDVMLNFTNMPQSQAISLPQLQVELLDSVVESASQFLLSLYADESAGELKLRLVYSQDVFSSDRMIGLLDQYQHLLEQMVADPDAPIGTYSLITPRTRALLPDPSLALAMPEYLPVTQRLAEWATRTPDQVAIVQGDRTWSYQDLWQRSQAIAQTLLAQGLQPSDVVAVTGDRQFELIASMIGVLLSGGVLLTIDPNLPPQRQQLMVEQADAKYFWPITEPIELMVMPLPTISPEDAAYIFFTSGSTGIPKAVLGNHKGLAHFLTWQQQTFDIQPTDRVAQLTHLSFDVVLRDIFLPLTSGATLCLPSDEVTDTIADGAKILPWLGQQQISVLHAVPSLVRSWLSQTLPPVSLSRLRWLFFAGEPLSDQVVQQWRQAFPAAGELVNLYGPTETTLAKSYYVLPRSPLAGIQSIGQALPHTQLLVLSGQRLCGVGEVGEIVVRSPFRTNGYLNSHTEQQRFVPNPFRPEAATDLFYYTGDLGRYCPDGTIAILGRIDDQVKIRGVRIEPAEIEAVLAQHDTVDQAVVMAYPDASGDLYLVAYLVLQSMSDETSLAVTLRPFLKARLPAVMIPTALIPLEQIPRLPNGKVDRRSLPAPDRQHLTLANPFVAPRNELEQDLAKIWGEVLSRSPIGIHDHFFELGGHSLSTTQVVARVRDRLGVDLSIRTMFERLTIAELAPEIQRLRANSDGQSDSQSNGQKSQIVAQNRALYTLHHDPRR
jgi:amino acid adenylation domain-containing protein